MRSRRVARAVSRPLDVASRRDGRRADASRSPWCTPPRTPPPSARASRRGGGYARASASAASSLSSVSAISASPCAADMNPASIRRRREIHAARERRVEEPPEQRDVRRLRVGERAHRLGAEEEAEHRAGAVGGERHAAAAPRCRAGPPPARACAARCASCSAGVSAASVAIPAAIASGLPDSVPA